MFDKIFRSRTRRRKGQAVVEMALMGMLLVLLLAGAVDFGRAYFTDVVVTNMAAEGAAYASLNPDFDLNYPSAGSCSNYPVAANKNIQDRVRLVAAAHGLIIKQQDEDLVTTTITPSCTSRCLASTIQVRVTYTINDLFFPRLLGRNSITITESASQLLQRSADKANCSGG